MKLILPWYREDFAWVRYHIEQSQIALGTINRYHDEEWFDWKAYPTVESCSDRLTFNGRAFSIEQAKDECDKALKSLGWQFVPNNLMVLK